MANWTDSDELALMFRNNFKPEYYKKLQRYVHHIFRKKQGLAHLQEIISGERAPSSRDARQLLATAYYFPLTAIEKKQLNV